MMACLVNLEATGNQGPVANPKVELRRESAMLYHFLVNLLKTTKMTCYRMDQDKYTYIQEGDPAIEHFCSLKLWAMMCKEIRPQTKVSTNNLETKLSGIIFAACNTSVPTLIMKMLDIKRQIEAEKGVTYEPDCFMMLLRTEQAAGIWADLMPSKLEITMLTTNLSKANIELLKMKSSSGGGGKGGGGGMGSGGGRGGGTGRGNGNRGARKGSGDTKDQDREWMLTRTTDTIKHPTKSYHMKWCKLCRWGHSKGTPAGMYMHAPHDHAK